MNVTFILALKDAEHSYATVDELKLMYAFIAPTGNKDLHFPMKSHQDDRIVGYVTEARLVEHENGAFIECDGVIEDEQFLNVPGAYMPQVARRATLYSIGA